MNAPADTSGVLREGAEWTRAPEVAPRLSRLFGEFEDPQIEAEFRTDHQIRLIPSAARTTNWFAMFVLSTFWFVDAAVVPEAGSWSTAIRFGFVLPFYTAMMLAARTRFYALHYGFFTTLGILVVTITVAAIGLAGVSPGRELYLAAATAMSLFQPAVLAWR